MSNEAQLTMMQNVYDLTDNMVHLLTAIVCWHYLFNF